MIDLDRRVMSDAEDDDSEESMIKIHEHQRQYQMTLRVYITYTGTNAVHNVTLAISAPPNITVLTQASMKLDVVGTDPTMYPYIYIYIYISCLGWR